MRHTKCYIPEYPRPQFVRTDWVNLNGKWAFGFGETVKDSDALKGNLPRSINVPFPYETELSGINEHELHEVVWYAREKEGNKGKRTIVNFDGVDYTALVYVNGALVGTHTGAYARFSFDVTDYLKNDKGVLTVKCIDPNHPCQVRGKQRWESKNFGCWYVQTTGIYKSVWIEYVEDTYLTWLKITPDLTDFSVKFDVSVNKPATDVEVLFNVTYKGKYVKSASIIASDIDNGVKVHLPSKNLTYQVETWNPNHPALYDLDIVVKKNGKIVDTVGSYFGLREYRAEGGKILLNNVTFYARLLLDQGYWPESGITVPSEDAIIKDIQLFKDMGFNGVRKHQKIEDERFFYYADIMGLTVWCELPSNHWFSDSASAQVTSEWLDIVKQNYNFPSLCTWVVFNESWGVRNIMTNEAQQSLANGLYYLTKSIDTMRPVVSNDGWVHTKSDLLTIHHYEQDGDRLFNYYSDIKKIVEGAVDNTQFPPYAKGYKYEGQPIIFSEFGGTAFNADAEGENWGYGNGVASVEEYIERYAGFISAIEDMHISGYCFTQPTDVEQEVNGLLKADRTPKVPIEIIAKINRKEEGKQNADEEDE